MNNRLINTKVAGGGGGCTDIVDNYDPFGNGVALYQLNGNANDVSGNYNGTATNVTYGTGVFGQAGVFNGSSSLISAPNNSLLTQTQFSVSAWVNHNSATGYRTIISNYGYTVANGESGWIIMLNAGKVRVFNIVSGAGYFVDSIASIPGGVFTNVAVTNTQSQVNIYINGSLDSTHSMSGFVFNLAINNYLTIGAYKYDAPGSPNGKFDGSIDQVRIFNTALTPLEVEALYTEELCICDGTVDTLDILGDGSCIATYQLDGNANDLSGNYSGTPTNVSYGVGEFDLSGVFNGSSSYITTPLTYNSIVNLNDKTQDFSFALWMYQSSLPSAGTKNVFAINEAAPSYQYIGLVVNGSNINFVSYPGGAAGDVATTTTDLNVWTHIACVRESSTMKIYKNGSLIDSNAMVYPNMSLDSTLRWVFGSRRDGANDNYFNGSIDQVRFFNKALSAGEVTTLYNETSCTVTYSNTEWGGAWDTVNSITSACTAGSSTLSFSNSNRTATESGVGFYVSAFSENQYGTFYLFATDAGGATTKFTGNFTDDTFIYRPILEEGVYAEILMEAPDLRLGITKNRVCSAPDQSAWYNNAIVYRNYNGQILRYNTVVTTTATFTVGDIIGILLDETAGIVTFYKNGAFVYTVNL